MNQKLRQRIADGMTDYSRIQKRLAVFLIEFWNDIPLMSIEQIAQRSGVSMATVTRFVRRFGFSGFFEFKGSIREEMTGHVNPVDRFRLLKTDFSGKESLVKVARQDVRNINRLLQMVKETAFNDLVQRIERATRVFTYGVSVSSILSRMFCYILNQVQKEAHCLDSGSMTVEERLFSLNSQKDLLIFASFYPYSKCTVDFAELARHENLQLVAISDNEFSPISQFANLTLAIPAENILYTSSVSAFSVLINAVATEIAIKKKEQLAESIRITDRKLRKFYILN
ncbi:MAG: MurR/RpiR family transcriptional regulator [Candidatus Aminicenantes bacterium]|nr:MurR/RpiR family transcriptional regulator [Candidatus Aminicenantes bacterium]